MLPVAVSNTHDSMFPAPSSPPHASTPPPIDGSQVVLIGVGVVGSAIADAHLNAKQGFILADQSAECIARAAQHWSQAGHQIESHRFALSELHAIEVTPGGEQAASEQAAGQQPTLFIESIVEDLAAKQTLFNQIIQHYGRDIVLGSNTSTLRIGEIASGTEHPELLCGMHFFMPVYNRLGVEVVRAKDSAHSVCSQASTHVRRLCKMPIECGDGPGFVINRMLCTYLNQALLLLCRGSNADQIQRVSIAYGMPLSPLELIDWIGSRTMFRAGRAFTNAFPGRLDASPVVPGMVKRGLLGRQTGQGLYQYDDRGKRSAELSPKAVELIETYRTDNRDFTDAEVLFLLAIPMWIEAQGILAEGLIDSLDSIDHAMVGGLGFQSDLPWSGLFAELGSDTVSAAIEQWQSSFASMRWPQ